MTSPGWSMSPRPAKPFLSRIVIGFIGGATLLGALSFILPAASEQGPNSFYTINNDSFAIRGMSRLSIAGPAITISADGDVKINWERVEQIITEPKEWDATTLAFARALIAVRDGIYERQE